MQRREIYTSTADPRIADRIHSDLAHLSKISNRPDAELRMSAAEQKRARKAAKRQRQLLADNMAAIKAAVEEVAARPATPKWSVIDGVIHRVVDYGVTLEVDTVAEFVRARCAALGRPVSDTMAVLLANAKREMDAEENGTLDDLEPRECKAFVPRYLRDIKETA
jgi:hypothetical protein